MEWARRELGGEEPRNLDPTTKDGIKSGQITEVTIRPRKAGFYGPDGKFIEAFDYAPGLGEDLELADKKWAQEEEDRDWADRENKSFNKSTVTRGPGIGRSLWEHGKRIAQYSESRNRSASALLHLLDRRKTADGYGRHTHQTSLDFYRWKPNLDAQSPLSDWSWERMDAVLRFSNRNEIRDVVASLLTRPELMALTDLQVTRLLARKERSKSPTTKPEDEVILEEVRTGLRHLRVPDSSLINRIRIVLGKEDVTPGGSVARVQD